MIIGIDASRANREKKTGVNWYAYHLIQELKRIVPSHIEIVLYTDKSLVGELAKLPENWTEKVLGWPPKRFWTQIRLSLEMLLNPPDILFVPAHVFPIIHPRRTLMTVHDIAATKFPESYNWFERWYSVWSARFAVKRLWKVVVPSQTVKEDVLENSRGDKTQLSGKIFAVPHGYDKIYRIIEEKSELKKVLDKYGVSKPYIMTIGRLEEKKNTGRIVKAFDITKKAFGNLQLLLIGKPGHGYEGVRAAINSSPNKEDIVTPGWVDEKDVPYLMNAAEAFVFPSLYEGFGIPILEAMACSTPVIAGSGSSLEEVGKNACVFVSPRNVNQIAKQIDRVLGSEKMKNRLKHAGLERAKDFSWAKCARKTWEILIER